MPGWSRAARADSWSQQTTHTSVKYNRIKFSEVMSSQMNETKTTAPALTTVAPGNSSLLWIPYLALTLILIAMAIASFLNFHFKNRLRYRPDKSMLDFRRNVLNSAPSKYGMSRTLSLTGRFTNTRRIDSASTTTTSISGSFPGEDTGTGHTNINGSLPGRQQRVTFGEGSQSIASSYLTYNNPAFDSTESVSAGKVLSNGKFIQGSQIHGGKTLGRLPRELLTPKQYDLPEGADSSGSSDVELPFGKSRTPKHHTALVHMRSLPQPLTSGMNAQAKNSATHKGKIYVKSWKGFMWAVLSSSMLSLPCTFQVFKGE